MENKDWLRRHVGELTAQQEQTQARPWALSDAPQSYVDAMLRAEGDDLEIADLILRNFKTKN
jgi:transcriptional regulator